MMSQASLAILPTSGLSRSSARQRTADLAVLATAAAVLTLFAVSPLTLEHFDVAYLTTGGGVLSKFHPATLLAALAFLLRCLASRRPPQTFWTLGTRDFGATILMAAVAIAASYALLVAKSPVTPLVDTFILPILFFLLLRDLDPTVLKWLALLVALVFCVNAGMAIYEFFAHTHVVRLPFAEGISSDPTRGDAIFDWRAEMMLDWRATALLGHPLANGLAVGCLILCLLASGSRWLPGGLKAPLLLLQSLSMLTFGARLSLVLTLVLGLYLAFHQWWGAFRRGVRTNPRTLALCIFICAVAVSAAIVLYQTGLFDRTLDRFTSDEGSARTRSTMLQMFQPFSWTDIMLGPNQDIVATWQRLYGLEFGIESSWIGLILNYGLLVAAFIMVGLLAFCRSVVRACGRGATTILLFYLISVSGTASLSGKTTSLAMAVTLALLYLPAVERRHPSVVFQRKTV